jgi:hypothetical protein
LNLRPIVQSAELQAKPETPMNTIGAASRPA